jgi:hypothetical protein
MFKSSQSASMLFTEMVKRGEGIADSGSLLRDLETGAAETVPVRGDGASA